MTERALQKAIMDLARTLGWKMAHFHDSRRDVGGGRHIGDADAKGWPDLVLAHEGRGALLFRELKGTGGVVSPDQAAWVRALKACGVDADIWTPADWPDRIADALSGVRSRSTIAGG